MEKLLSLLRAQAQVSLQLLRKLYWNYFVHKSIRLDWLVWKKALVIRQKNSLPWNLDSRYHKSRLMHNVNMKDLLLKEYSNQKNSYYLTIKVQSVILVSSIRLSIWHLWDVSILYLTTLLSRYLKVQKD